MAIEENGNTTLHYVYTDHLGSINAVTNTAGVLEAKLDFDAWGRRRNPVDYSYLPNNTVQIDNGLNTSSSLPAWLYRGYTGHEMLDEFTLINMNARLYDPVLGLMAGVDNVIQAPNYTQNYSRYSYCDNNPLKYTDPDGNRFTAAHLALAGVCGQAAWGPLMQHAMGQISTGQAAINYGVNAVTFIASAGLTGGTDLTTFQYLSNMAISQIVSTFSPSLNIPIGENLSISVSPTVGFGTGGFGIGANVGVTYKAELGNDFYSVIGIDAGIGSYGDGEFRFGGGLAVGRGNVEFGVYSTYYHESDGSSQRVGGASLSIGEFTARYENDWYFGVPLGDGGDRYRTMAAQISWRQLKLGMNMYTGAPEERVYTHKQKQRLTDQGWVNNADLNSSMCYVETSTPRLCAAYLGYRDVRIGYNSENLRYKVQNEIVHKRIDSPYFIFSDTNSSNLYARKQTSFRYSLW